MSRIVGAIHIIQGVLLWLWRLEEDDAAWKERITDIATYIHDGRLQLLNLLTPALLLS